MKTKHLGCLREEEISSMKGTDQTIIIIKEFVLLKKTLVLKNLISLEL